MHQGRPSVQGVPRSELEASFSAIFTARLRPSVAIENSLPLGAGLVQRTASSQHVVRYARQNLSQGQQQCLGSRHVERAGIPREEFAFQNSRFIRSYCLSQRLRYSAFKPRVILHRYKVRVILTEPRQHSSVYVSVKVIHQKGAEDRDSLLMRQVGRRNLQGSCWQQPRLVPTECSPSRPTIEPSDTGLLPGLA